MEIILNKSELELGVKKDCIHYVSLDLALKNLLEDKSTISMMKKEENRIKEKDNIVDIKDGTLYKSMSDLLQHNWAKYRDLTGFSSSYTLMDLSSIIAHFQAREPLNPKDQQRRSVISTTLLLGGSLLLKSSVSDNLCSSYISSSRVILSETTTVKNISS